MLKYLNLTFSFLHTLFNNYKMYDLNNDIKNIDVNEKNMIKKINKYCYNKKSI